MIDFFNKEFHVVVPTLNKNFTINRKIGILNTTKILGGVNYVI